MLSLTIRCEPAVDTEYSDAGQSRAKILLERTSPLRTGSFSTTGDGTSNPFTTVNRQDVGIELWSRPSSRTTTYGWRFCKITNVINTPVGGSAFADVVTSKRTIETPILILRRPDHRPWRPNPGRYQQHQCKSTRPERFHYWMPIQMTTKTGKPTYWCFCDQQSYKALKIHPTKPRAVPQIWELDQPKNNQPASF